MTKLCMNDWSELTITISQAKAKTLGWKDGDSLTVEVAGYKGMKTQPYLIVHKKDEVKL